MGLIPFEKEGTNKNSKFNVIVFVHALVHAHNVAYTVELQWLEHLRDRENMFETEVVRASKC